MIQLKTRELAERVLAPKVEGTMNLYDVFKDSGLDFLIYCSSLNAVTGGFGQADYSAANAFMDAFAQAHDSPCGTRHISINWDRWPGVGMAMGFGSRRSYEDEHPLLGRKVADDPQKAIYMAEMSPEKDWVLSEHLVMGVPTIAGTTYLQMAKCAFEEMEGQKPTEFSHVVFLMPMGVKENERRQVFTVMEKKDSGYEFRIYSKLHGQVPEPERAGWQEHARGSLSPVEGVKGTDYDIMQLEAACNKRIMDMSRNGERPSEEFIRFGGRWRSLKKFSLGEDRALVEVQLGDEFAGELGQYRLHPALLDVITGSVRLAAEGSYLPFSYERMVINGDIPQKAYGHISFKKDYDGGQHVITANIDIMDDRGRGIIQIQGFSMKLIVGDSLNIKGRNEEQSHHIRQLESLAYAEELPEFNEGITEEEGQKVLDAVMGGCGRAQILVSVKDLKTAMEQADYINLRKAAGEQAKVSGAKNRHKRPELDNEYVSPKNETEKKLVELWQDLLKLDGVGIHDEFFALGGDSLLQVQLHSKLKESFSTDIAVVDLYKYNTIAALAKYMSSSKEEEEQPVFSEVNQRAGRQLEAMRQKRQQKLQKGGRI